LIILLGVINYLKTSSKLSEEKFVEVYVQLSIASEMYDTSSTELKEERKKILEKYNVTQEEIDRFIKEYNQNPEKWANVWEKIVRRVEEEVDRSSKEKTTPP
jgi:SOS response regulatory protein OraA/RecX